MRNGSLRVFVFLLAAAWAGGPAGAENPAKGRFLVADRSLSGSNFAETVVLLIRYDAGGAMGLVVNRETPIQAAKLLPDISVLADRGGRAYVGGPVETYKIFLLLRADSRPAGAVPVVDDVYFANNLDPIAGQSAPEPGSFRIYAGYAGWAPGQLDAELDRGAWSVLPGESEAVFDANPQGLWERLIRRTEFRIARGLKTLQGLTPDEYICIMRSAQLQRFDFNPIHRLPGTVHLN